MESWEHSQDQNEASSISARLDKLAEDIKKLPPERVAKLESVVRTMGKKSVTIAEAAEILSASITTIRRAVRSGKLKSYQLNDGGKVYIPMEEIERMVRGERIG